MKNASQQVNLVNLMKKLEARGLLEKTKDGKTQISSGLRSDENIFKTISPKFIQDLIERAKHDEYEDTPEGEALKTATLGRLRDLYMDAIPNRAVQRYMQPREGIHG